MKNYTKLIAVICVSVMSIVQASNANAAELEKRTVVGVYDSKLEGDPRFTRVHHFLEMPLNHLGYKVTYQDIHAPLKKLGSGVQGVVVWLDPATRLTKNEEWLAWLNQVVDSGHKLIIFGNTGFSEKFHDTEEGVKKINVLLNKIGVQDNNRWFNLTYDAKVKYVDPYISGFERKYKDILKPYMSLSRVGKDSRTHLQVMAPQYDNEISDLVISNPRGGYVSMDYDLYEHYNAENEVTYHQWYINPFRFLQLILDDKVAPKADVSTLNGRRIFYTHIDGDGWNNITELEEYKGKRVIVAEVVLNKILKEFSEFPFTVGVVASELMTQCYGVPASEAVAREIFKLPNVEPGSHTYSHPLYWGFYADGKGNEKEKEYSDLYPDKPYEQFFMSKWFSSKEVKTYNPKQKFNPTDKDPKRGINTPKVDEKEILKDYTVPRSYNCEPFSISREITGSARYIESLAGGKKVKLYQWSGDTRPFEGVIAEARLNGIYNINGGGARYDVEYPSYTSIASIGAEVGDERQIYSSNTNENDYTNLWTGRFFGFRYLQTTVSNTETPIRVHPFNIYFHSYSGQKKASLAALRENFKFAQQQKLSPIFASDYVKMANNFYNIGFVKIGENAWRVENRGNISTVRFDLASGLAVDINKSKGVLGQKFYQGSLYVSLENGVKNPVIQLKNRDFAGGYPREQKPYLIESNRIIKSLQFIKNKLIFSAEGLGKPDMIWKQPSAGKYRVRVQNDRKIIYEDVFETDKNGLLHLNLPTTNSSLNVTITHIAQAKI